MSGPEKHFRKYMLDHDSTLTKTFTTCKNGDRFRHLNFDDLLLFSEQQLFNMDGVRIKGEVRVDNGTISLTVQCGPENGGQSRRRDPWSRLGQKENPSSEPQRQRTKNRKANKNQRNKLKGKTKQVAESLKRKKGQGQSQAVRNCSKSSIKPKKQKATGKVDQNVLKTADIGWTPTVFADFDRVRRPELAEWFIVPDQFVKALNSHV